MGDIPTPANEAQVRELAPLIDKPDELRASSYGEGRRRRRRHRTKEILERLRSPDGRLTRAAGMT